MIVQALRLTVQGFGLIVQGFRPIVLCCYVFVAGEQVSGHRIGTAEVESALVRFRDPSTRNLLPACFTFILY